MQSLSSLMSRRVLFFTLLVAGALCGAHCHPLIPTPSLGTRPSQGVWYRDYPAPNDGQTTGSYIAVLREATSPERLMELVKLLNDTVEGCVVYGYVEVAVKAITMELSDEALQKVRHFREVKYVEKDSLAYAAGSESLDGDRWYLDRLDQLTLPLDNSYQPLTGGGEGVDVYVLDTGIKYQHQEFGYRTKYAGYDPVDQYEYEKGTHNYAPKGGADCNGHGTHVASLIGGKTYGTARKANLYSVRVLRCDTSAPWSIVLDGLDFVATIIPKRSQNAIVVLALSGPLSNSVNDAIESLHRQDVVIIAAAGNNGVDACQRSPTSSPYAITVGATDREDNVVAQSNYGSCIDLYAPGENISGASYQCDTCTAMMSGSTQAAGLTAGVAASYFSQLPHLTPVQLKDKLLSQSVKGVINFDVIPEDYQSNTSNTLLNLMCGGKILVSSEPGRLQSPGFPSNYPSNLNCMWTLVAENDTEKVLLNFTYIKLEKNYDIITLCHGDQCNEQDRILLTGDYAETECGYKSFRRSFTVMMSTDSSTESPGFSAVYTTVGSDEEINKCFTMDVDNTKTSMQLDIYSAGFNVGNRFSMKKDWVEFFAGRRRGINLAILDEVSGSILTTESFDTYISQASSNQLAAAIEQVRPGRIVVTAVSDEGMTNLNAHAKRALMSLGSDKINQLTFQESWALIGTKGTPRGHALEQVLSSAPVHLSPQVHLQPFHKHGIEVSVESAGHSAGNYATIKIDGAVVNIPSSGYNRGLNVVILDQVSGITLHKEIFDTSVEGTINSPSNRFVSLVRSQRHGTTIAIAIKDEGVDQLSESAKQACDSIGSVLIRQVSHRGSWAIVGRKGAPRGSVPEAASNSGPSKATFFLARPSADATPCPVALQSSGHSGIGASIMVNKVRRISSLSQGITIALLGDSECAIKTSRTFTSSQSNQLVDFIKLIPPGRVVLASISDDGVQHMTDGGRAALEAIGSAVIRNVGYRQAWAIIGKKGAPRGSALEEQHAYSTAIGTTTTLSSADTPYTSLIISSAGKLVGNYAKFVVNGETLQITSAYGRGLNVAIINERNNSILHKQVFDTYAYPIASSSFVNLINSLPNGRVVAIAIKDEGTYQLSEAAKQAIEGLGSKYIRQIRFRGSWAIIGRKGARQGTVLEAGSNVGPTEIVSHTLPNSQHHNSECNIFVESAGFGSLGGLQLTINGVTSSMPRARGIRVAVFEVDRCAVEMIKSYDTHARIEASTQLATFLASLSTGRVVVASINDEGISHLTENAKLALESIGSALIRSVGFRDGWAIVGRKGAASGSVPESFVPSVSRDGSSSVAVGGLMEVRPLTCNVLYPLDCLMSETE